jgi:ribosomal protein S18 acetylase RimI-like enzyme
LAGFLVYDSSGCFVAQADGRPIGICVATDYGESGFIGELIVVKDMRGRGVGRRLLEHAIEYLHKRGAQNVLLDGDPDAIPLYERVGFRKVCRSLRFTGTIQGRVHPHVRAMKVADLDAIGVMDRKAFGADRRFFLERAFSLYPELGKVIEFDGTLAGFIVGRRGRGVVSAGPWVVQPGLEHPGDLLENLAVEASDSLRVGILETNSEAVATIRRYGFVEHPDPPWRMVLGPSEQLASSNQLYAIGSASKG